MTKTERKELLDGSSVAWAVLPLFSPPYCPSKINAILDAADTKNRARYKPVKRYKVENGERAGEYWVLQSVSVGTTHGKRHETYNDIIADMEARFQGKRIAFLSELEETTSDEIQRQFDFWVK